MNIIRVNEITVLKYTVCRIEVCFIHTREDSCSLRRHFCEEVGVKGLKEKEHSDMIFLRTGHFVQKWRLHLGGN